jgi:hypothetical protein
MSNDPISSLPIAVGALSGAEEFPGNQAGTTKRISASQIATLANGNVIPTTPTLIPIETGGSHNLDFGAYGYSIMSTVASALTLNLPSAEDRAGIPLYIVDLGGVLFTYNATLVCDGSDLIQGQSTFIMDNNYETAILYPAVDAVGDSIGWFLVTG